MQLLGQGFTHVIFEHCYREVNTVAHVLAAHVEGGPPDQTCVWSGDPPDFIVSNLVNNVTFI